MRNKRLTVNLKQSSISTPVTHSPGEELSDSEDELLKVLEGVVQGVKGEAAELVSNGSFVFNKYLSKEKSLLPDFHFDWRCGNTKLINLYFAEDLMIYCKGDLTSVNHIQAALTEFHALSGLSPCPGKSSIYFSGVNTSSRLAILNVLGFKEGTLPIRHLEVPLISTKLKASDRQRLVDSITAKTKSWINRDLTYSDLKKTGAKVSWEHLCSPKRRGGVGLGFKSMQVWIVPDFWGEQSMWCQWAEYITQRAILATRNESVDMLNEKLIAGEERKYVSHDEAIDDTHCYYLDEFFNTLTSNGLPPHELVLKVNSPIMLLKNLNPSVGLCNGTRMVCKGFQRNVIHAEITLGQQAGKQFFKILEDLTSLLRGTEQDTLITMFGNVDQDEDKVSTLKEKLPKDIDDLIDKAIQAKLHEVALIQKKNRRRVKAEFPKEIQHVLEKAFQAKVKDLKWKLHTAILMKRIKVVEFNKNNFKKMHILIIPHLQPKRRIKEHHNNQSPTERYTICKVILQDMVR
ncbi:hypothetical protein RHSIM_Rhsim12G0101400 [Rhododendron simsii]|uniref:DNA helicase Pif1-like 2B domain-containing protein n=1 Tax=Rhododendron simsii TaxID=118357 RepID=A0A834G1R9_RHOSS|nr:hypothetical protein RHSIM_Rhsim12G0101400 [Rhododendron simsii]